MEKIKITVEQSGAIKTEFRAKCKNALAVAVFEKLVSDRFEIVEPQPEPQPEPPPEA